jgi:Zn-dependent protease
MDINSFIQTALVYVLPVLFAITLHEAAHAYSANYFGDPTAAEEGHLSLNPLHHISLFGTILLPLLLVMLTLPPAGYAKPVPIEIDRLRQPKLHSAYVAAAGPAANFVMGLGWMAAWVILLRVIGLDGSDFFVKMAEAGVAINSVMIVINLIPIPPLDGGGILMGILPDPVSRKLEWFDRHPLIVILPLFALLQYRPVMLLLYQAMHAVQRVFHLLVHPLISLFN